MQPTAHCHDTGIRRGAFGSGFEGQLFGTGKTPRDPFALAHLAGEIAHSLRNPKLKEQLSGNRFAQFDWNATADDLGGKAARLEKILHDLVANAAGQTSAVRRKDQAAEEFDRTQKGMFKVLEGLMEMAGMDDMARQLRPTVPSKRGASADPVTSDEPEAVERAEERSIPTPVADEDEDRAKIAAAGGSRSPTEPSSAPLRWVESASQATGTTPDTSGSAPRAVAAASDPSAAAEPRIRPSSGLHGDSTHPVRTASDPPGAASHRGPEDSGEVAVRRHAV